MRHIIFIEKPNYVKLRYNTLKSNFENHIWINLFLHLRTAGWLCRDLTRRRPRQLRGIWPAVRPSWQISAANRSCCSQTPTITKLGWTRVGELSARRNKPHPPSFRLEYVFCLVSCICSSFYAIFEIYQNSLHQSVRLPLCSLGLFSTQCNAL